MNLPSQSEIDDASFRFDEDWGEVDRVLYELCGTHPDHAARRFVAAKVAIVGRAYAAGLERCISPGAREQAIMLGVQHMWEHGADVDAIIAAIKAITEPLTAVALQQIVEQHGRLTDLLAEMPSCTRRPRSFAAKYLHFHHPVVPIYDSYAEIALGKLVPWKASLSPFDRPAHADEWYYLHCARLYRLYAACLEEGLKVTTKMLDTYLWTIPT